MDIETLECRKDGMSTRRRTVVEEKIFRVSINGRELMSLVASPHDPTQLLTGFLFLQGLIGSADEIVSLGICSDSGTVSVALRGTLPEQFTPTLTSGCGGGIELAGLEHPAGLQSSSGRAIFSPDFIWKGMTELAAAAQQYATHGGIHSAALFDNSGLRFYAEDLGRHNTIDRIAGAALIAGQETGNTLLLTSGRISSEMAVKAARLGVAAIASRTSPTGLALRVCRHCRIGLAGYVRAGSMEIYTGSERFGIAPANAEGIEDDRIG